MPTKLGALKANNRNLWGNCRSGNLSLATPAAAAKYYIK